MTEGARTFVRRGAAALFVASLALLAGCALFDRKLPQEPGYHPRLTPRTYIEEGNLLIFTVDVSPTVWRDDKELIPIAFALANKSMQRITLTRESFTLVDEEGNRYPLASVQEMRRTGVLSNGDWNAADHFFEVTQGYYDSWVHQPSVFFPVLTTTRLGRRGVVRDKVELNLRMWTADMLYFPHPKGSIKDKKLELWLSAPELKEPVFVKVHVK